MNPQAHTVIISKVKLPPMPPTTQTVSSPQERSTAPRVPDWPHPTQTGIDGEEQERQGSLAMLHWLVMDPEHFH